MLDVKGDLLRNYGKAMEKNGYQIKCLDVISSDFGKSHMYPLLHGLEEKNFVSCYEQEVVGKVRKYYSLTATGRKRLEEKKEEWKVYAKAVTDVLTMEG